MTEPQPLAPQSKAGATFDAWYPRVLKIVGLAGVGLSLVMWTIGQFNPVVFGGCLTIASGGFVGDALSALKSGKE